MKAIDEVVPPTNLKELQSLLAFFSTAEDQERSEVYMG
jgi:hypothetical protein